MRKIAKLHNKNCTITTAVMPHVLKTDRRNLHLNLSFQLITSAKVEIPTDRIPTKRITYGVIVEGLLEPLEQELNLAGLASVESY